jgi:adenylate cyclase
MGSMEAEKEVKYLLKTVPEGLEKCKSKKLVDIYIPRKEGHAAIRIRQQGDSFFITKKTPEIVDGVKVLNEETINIIGEDFNVFRSMKDAKILDKTRYYYPLGDNVVEIDVFSGKLNGLVLAEVEFSSIDALKAFEKPGFFLIDVTNQDFLAGGVLYKSSYAEIENRLKCLGYSALSL